MFTYLTLLISHVYTVYTVFYTPCLCCSAIAHPYTYMYIFSFNPLDLCVLGGELLDYLLDITALSELEAQAFRYTRINIC